MNSYRAALKNAEHFDTKVCRRLCPHCNLETVVRKKQLNKLSSGLHVICYQCKLDWCFICEAPWHPGAACSKLCCNSLSDEGKTEHQVLGESMRSDERDRVSTVFVTLNFEALQEILKDRSRDSSTRISIQDRPTPSITVKYINRVEDEASVIINLENTCDICLANSIDDIRPCCQIKVCGDCFKTYLTSKISNGLTNITCPNHGCNHPVSGSEISSVVDGVTFLKYQQFLVNANQDPNRKTCPQCSYITVIDTSNATADELRIRCPGCDLSWCFSCQAPWHLDMTCSEFQSRDDDVFKKWASDFSSGQINARKCPTCKVYIQRDGGCDQMKCTQCGTNFCYQCGEKGFYHRHDGTRIVGANAQQPCTLRRCLTILGCVVGIILLYLVFVFIVAGIPVLVASRSPSDNTTRTPSPYTYIDF